eukprot:10373462-Alexandrium_andersonii.AAC.1
MPGRRSPGIQHPAPLPCHYGSASRVVEAFPASSVDPSCLHEWGVVSGKYDPALRGCTRAHSPAISQPWA